MKITENPGTGLRGLTEEDPPAKDSIKEKEIGGADPDQDPPEEISAETILSQDSEVMKDFQWHGSYADSHSLISKTFAYGAAIIARLRM